MYIFILNRTADPFYDLQFCVEATDTIESVKQKIQDIFPFITKCHLIFNAPDGGKILYDDFALQDYKIPDETTLHFFKQLDGFHYYNNPQINIEVNHSKTNRLNINGHSGDVDPKNIRSCMRWQGNLFLKYHIKIDEIKQRIMDQGICPIPPERQRLIYNGRHLDDGDLTLRQFCIANSIKIPGLTVIDNCGDQIFDPIEFNRDSNNDPNSFHPPLKLEVLGGPWIRILRRDKKQLNSGFILDVDLSDTIDIIKQKIQDKDFIPLIDSTLSLMSKGVRLKDGCRSLRDYNIQSGCSLRLFYPHNPFLNVESGVGVSLVYSIINILFHKFIVMDFSYYIELTETFDLEDLYHMV